MRGPEQVRITRDGQLPVLVTGASSGIGRATARSLVAAGIPVFGAVRRQVDATEFDQELGPLGRALIFDLRDQDAIASAADQVLSATGGGGVRALINNASGSLAGPLEHVPLADFKELLDVGLTGVLAATQAFLPLLRRAAAGGQSTRIVNVSSLFGEVVAPFLAPYSVIKFGLEAMSDGLRRELRPHGIKVVVIQPSAVGSRFWDRILTVDLKRYSQTPYADQLNTFQEMFGAQIRTSLEVEKVAQLVLRIVHARRPRTRYRPSAQPFTHGLMRMLPDTVLDRIFSRSARPRLPRGLRPISRHG